MKNYTRALKDSKFKPVESHLKGTELDPGPDYSFKFGGKYELILETLLDGSPAVGGPKVTYIALYENGELITGEKIPVLPSMKGGEK